MAVQDAPILQRDGWMDRIASGVTGGGSWYPWIGVAALVLTMVYRVKYSLADWYFTGWIKADNHYGSPVLDIYWGTIFWFGVIGVAILVLEPVFDRITPIRWLRTQFLGATFVAVIASAVLVWPVLYLDESMATNVNNYAVDGDYGPGWQLDWWQIGELIATGETCDPHQPDRPAKIRVDCYTGFTRNDIRPTTNDKVPEAPWYSFI